MIKPSRSLSSVQTCTNMKCSSSSDTWNINFWQHSALQSIRCWHWTEARTRRQRLWRLNLASITVHIFLSVAQVHYIQLMDISLELGYDAARTKSPWSGAAQHNTFLKSTNSANRWTESLSFCWMVFCAQPGLTSGYKRFPLPSSTAGLGI